MSNVTWVKLVGEDRAIWIGVRGDMIVQARGGHAFEHAALLHQKADDTLSELARMGWRLEGPFDEPE